LRVLKLYIKAKHLAVSNVSLSQNPLRVLKRIATS